MQIFTLQCWRRCGMLALIMSLFWMIPSKTLGQGTVTVSGTVSSKDDGSSLPGTSVKLKNGTIGTTTDVNGKYSISVPQGAVLIFSLVGFEQVEQTVKENTMNIVMTTKQGSLNEVVVIGYGTTTKQNLTTAVTKIDPKKIPTAANSSVPEMLFGRAAGLQVTQQSSQPGGNINISVRGKGTPLYVVDGVLFPSGGLEPSNGSSIELQGVNRGALAGLNPNDIESIEVLKDASAAIYGVSAANGVILITTKKGKAGRMNISYDGNRSLVKNLPYLKPLSPTDYMSYFNQLSRDKYLSDRNMAPFGTVAPNLTGYTQTYSAAQIAAAGVGTDWLGQVLRNGSVDNHNISINGGTEKLTYFFSGQYFNQQGTVKGSDLTRYSGRMNLSFELASWVKLNTNISANRNSYGNPQAGWQTGGSGTQGFNALQAALAYPTSVPVYDATGAFSIFRNTGNPLSLLTINDKTKFEGMLSNFSLDFILIPKMLTAKVLYGNNSENSVRDFYIPSDVFFGQLYKSRASLGESRRLNQTMEASVSFKKNIKNILNIDAVMGVGRYLNDNSGFGIETSNVLDAINTENLATATGPRVISSYIGRDQLRSFFIRTNFDFLDRYLLSLSLRRDGTDKFYPDNKYQNFPSISGAWKISSEPFFKGIDVISLAKIRASYGTTGTSPGTAAYGIYGPDATAITFNNGSVVYIPYRQTAFDNPNLRWPITKTLDLGFDFGILKDRINGSVDWYREELTRLVQNAATAQLSTISTAPVNGGHQRREGIDISLNSTNIQTENFSWSSNINFTNFKIRWVERFSFDPLPRGGSLEDPIGTIYVYETNGILQQGQTVPTTQPNGAKKPGSPLFVDQNGNGVLDDGDITKKAGVPKGIIGFGNNFRYKNIDLAVFMYGQYGAWGYDYTTKWGDPLALLAGNQSGTDRIKQAWSTSNTAGTLPGAAYNETTVTGLNAGIDTRLAKRDFIRCRNITAGYTFGGPAIQKFAKSIRVFADVQNAFIITGFKSIDPEIQAANANGGPAPYPMARTISLGLRANF